MGRLPPQPPDDLDQTAASILEPEVVAGAKERVKLPAKDTRRHFAIMTRKRRSSADRRCRPASTDNGLSWLPTRRLLSVADAEPSGGEVGRSRRHDGRKLRRVADPLYEDHYLITYEESVRTLDDQADEVNRIRDRSVQFIVFVGAATAFLVGSGLQAAHRDSIFYAIAGVASAASVLMIVLLFLVLNPPNKRLWNYRVSAKKMIAIFEADVAPSKSEFVRYLSLLNDDSREGNEKLLKPLRAYYRSLIIVGSVQVTIWAALVWARA